MQIIPFTKKMDSCAQPVGAHTTNAEDLRTRKQQNTLDSNAKTVGTGSGTVVPLHRSPLISLSLFKEPEMTDTPFELFDEQEDILAGMPLPSDDEMKAELDRQYELALQREKLNELIEQLDTE